VLPALHLPVDVHRAVAPPPLKVAKVSSPGDVGVRPLGVSHPDDARAVGHRLRRTVVLPACHDPLPVVRRLGEKIEHRRAEPGPQVGVVLEHEHAGHAVHQAILKNPQVAHPAAVRSAPLRELGRHAHHVALDRRVRLRLRPPGGPAAGVEPLPKRLEPIRPPDKVDHVSPLERR